MTTTLHPPGDAPMNDDEDRRDRVPVSPGVPLRVPLAVFAIVFLGGLILALAPGENFLDRAGFILVPASIQSRFLHAASELARGPVTAGVALATALIVWRLDRRRAFACLVGPALAVGLAELLKIIVGRRLGGALCWPSGSTAAVAAMATVGALVARGRARGAVLVFGSAALILEVVALLAYRSHYPTDCLGGALVGAGSVLLADAVLHLPPFRRRPATAAPLEIPV